MAFFSDQRVFAIADSMRWHSEDQLAYWVMYGIFGLALLLFIIHFIQKAFEEKKRKKIKTKRPAQEEEPEYPPWV